MEKIKIAVVDTTFARVNMGDIALDELKKHNVETIRRTVPGFKDLAVECKRLLENEGCSIALALGMAGDAPIDIQCAHEASMAIMQAKLMTNKHILEVFVFENETWSERELGKVFDNRIRAHCRNAVVMVSNQTILVGHAGKGIRQGKEDEGTISVERTIGIGIVYSEFNDTITSKMLETAKKQIEKSGARITEIISVPGAYDIPLAVKKLLLGKETDAVATLGAIIKGETDHDELIAETMAHTLTRLSLEFNKPVTLGVIGPDATEEQARARAEGYAEHAVNSAAILAQKLRR